MMDVETTIVNDKVLPSTIDYYVIEEDGSLSESLIPKADVYIEDYQVRHLSDKEVTQHIRSTYGKYIGVMREVDYQVFPEKCHTSKVLLGVMKGMFKQE